jgi:hypothetical protein
VVRVGVRVKVSGLVRVRGWVSGSGRVGVGVKVSGLVRVRGWVSGSGRVSGAYSQWSVITLIS